MPPLDIEAIRSGHSIVDEAFTLQLQRRPPKVWSQLPESPEMCLQLKFAEITVSLHFVINQITDLYYRIYIRVIPNFTYF